MKGSALSIRAALARMGDSCQLLTGLTLGYPIQTAQYSSATPGTRLRCEVSRMTMTTSAIHREGGGEGWRTSRSLCSSLRL